MQSDLLEEDYAAARIAVNNAPTRFAQTEAMIHFLARQHARLGPSRFGLRYGLRPPRNRLERAFLNFWHGRLTREALQDLLAQEAKLPLDQEVLQSCYEGLEERVSYYGRVRRTAFDAVHDPAVRLAGTRNEVRIERYIREMGARLSLLSPQMSQICDLLEEARLELRLRPAGFGSHRAATASVLALRIMDQTKDAWRRCQSTARLSRTAGAPVPPTTAPRAFLEHWNPLLPPANELIAMLQEEFAAARMCLREQLRGEAPDIQILNHVHVPPSQIHFSPQIVVPGLTTAGAVPEEKAGTNSDAPTAPTAGVSSACPSPRLKNWAVGVESPGTWWLFHMHCGRWHQRCRVAVPSGNPERILQALADQGGSLAAHQARRLFQPSYPDRHGRLLTRVVTDALAKAKCAIKDAVAIAANCTLSAVGNPIPHAAGTWRCAVSVGFAVQSDEGQLAFRTREQM